MTERRIDITLTCPRCGVVWEMTLLHDDIHTAWAVEANRAAERHMREHLAACRGPNRLSEDASEEMDLTLALEASLAIVRRGRTAN